MGSARENLGLSWDPQLRRDRPECACSLAAHIHTSSSQRGDSSLAAQPLTLDVGLMPTAPHWHRCFLVFILKFFTHSFIHATKMHGYVKGTADQNCPPWPDRIVTTCMSYLRTGGPGKERGTNKPPPSGRIQERSKEER